MSNWLIDWLGLFYDKNLGNNLYICIFVEMFKIVFIYLFIRLFVCLSNVSF